MPLKLLRGAPRRAAAPPRLAGTDEESLTRAYLDLFAREARWPERRAETGLLGLEDGVSTEVSLRIAVRAASIYLRSHEAEIVLLVPEETRLEAGFTTQLESYIAQRYTGGGGLFGRSFDRAPPRPPGTARVFAAAPAERVRSLEDMLKKVDAGFSETLLRLIDKSGRKDSEVYKAANIDRKLFSKIRSNPGYRPSKATALALAFALRLDLDATRDLIGRAGYTLTHASVMDIIIEYYITNGNYDIFELNETLFRYDQPILGGT